MPATNQATLGILAVQHPIAESAMDLAGSMSQYSLRGLIPVDDALILIYNERAIARGGKCLKQKLPHIYLHRSHWTLDAGVDFAPIAFRLSLK
jgi:hypothetical protein